MKYKPKFRYSERIDRTMLELRDAGLSFRDISVVLDLYEGIEVDTSQVRYRLRRLGTPISEARRACGRPENLRRAKS